MATALTIGLGSCFWFAEDNTVALGNNYQVVTTADGNNFRYFEDPEWPASEPLLSGISAIGTTDTCLVVYQAGHYYVFSRCRLTHDAVLATRVGPLTKAALSRKLYQATGDSTLQLRPI